MKEYLKDAKSVLKELDSTLSGLDEDEAKKRLETNGPNKLEEKKKESLLKRFFKKLSDPMLIILMIAAILSIVISVFSGGPELAEAIIILTVVLINAVLGIVQESKAEKAIEALQSMSKAKSKVRRDGKPVTLDGEKLVPGDIIKLEAGDSVPADARIIMAASMKAEEAALTGESVPVEKNPDILPGITASAM